MKIFQTYIKLIYLHEVTYGIPVPYYINKLVGDQIPNQR